MDSPFGPDVQDPMLPRLYSASARCRLGARDVKPRYMGRPQVPADTLEINRMWKAAVCANTPDEWEEQPGTDDYTCHLCRRPSPPTVTTCVVCGVAAHWDSCLKSLLQKSGTKTALLGHVAEEAALRAIQIPDVFGPRAMCQLCHVMAASQASFEDVWSKEFA